MPITPIGTTSKGLFEDVSLTYLTADAAAAATTLTVLSIRDIAIKNVLFIGELGGEESEIIKTHSVTAPTGTTVTLAAGLVFAHTQGTKIYVIDYDQIEVSWAATATGAKAVLNTVDIDADTLTTVYRDSEKTSGYYFVRFKNTFAPATYSDYSDPIPYAGFGESQVAKIIDYALRRNKLESFTDNITHQFCIDEINACLKYMRGKRKKWSKLQQFDYQMGQTSQGEWAFAVPTDMWGYSNKSVLDIHLEGEEPLTYKDERAWNEMLEGVVYDAVSADAAIGATTIYLTNSFSFGDSGTLMVAGNEITFSANDTSAGKLTVTALTVALTAGEMAWKGSYSEGLPNCYTVKEGYVNIYPLPDSSYDNVNVVIDYWKEAPEIDSDADTLDVSRYDLVKYWLVWAVRSQVKNDGMRDPNDADYLMFERMLRDALYVEANTSGQKYKFKPKLNIIKF